MLRKISLILLSAPLALTIACSDDGGGNTEPEVDAGAQDTGSTTEDTGTEEDVGEDTTPEPTGTLSITLVNSNPGGNSRWVQATTNIGTAGWWSIQEDSMAPTDLRAQLGCNLCSCGDDCTPCEPAPEIIELAPGESITAEWDYVLYDQLNDGAGICLDPYDADQPTYRMRFEWSPNAPVDGVLDPNTLSSTRLPFRVGVDTDVSYAIEALNTCGNGTCDVGETSVVCPDDCEGLTPSDAVVACQSVCSLASACSVLEEGECEASFCAGILDAGDLTDECIIGYVERFACVDDLECSDFEAWAGGESSPCDAEEQAFIAACEG